jgi:hypothetical protein
MDDFEKWWDETYGQILVVTGDHEADAASRIAKIAAMDAWKTAAAIKEPK